MQLKKPEEPIEEPKTNNDGMPGSGIINEAAAQSGAASNNDFFNPEMEFDPIGDGIFDTPQPLNTGMNNQAGANAYGAATGVNMYGNMNDPYSAQPGAGNTYGGANNQYGGAGNTYGGANNQYGGAGTNYSQPGGPQEPDMSSHPRKLTKHEFFESPRNRKDRDRIILSSIVVIVLAICDVIRTDFWLSVFKKQIDLVNDLSSQFGLGEQYTIDPSKIMRTQIIISVLFIALAVGIWVYKSRACAIVGFVLTIINFILGLRSFGQFKWYWTVIAFIFAIGATFSFNSNWKDYEANGEWKREW